MKRQTWIGVGIAAIIASATTAAEIEPMAVAFTDDGAVAEPLTATAGDPVAGRKVVGTKSQGNCVACHQISEMEGDVPFHGEVGPTLDGAGDRWTEAELRGIVANAKVMFEDTMMPSFYKKSGYIRPGKAYTGKSAKPEELSTLLTAQQIEDVVAYLATLNE